MAARFSPRSLWPVTMAALLVALAACTSVSPGRPSASARQPSGSTGSSPVSSPPASVIPSGNPDAARIRAPVGGSLLARGSYPHVHSKCVRPESPSLLARYPGTPSVERSADGTLALTVTLPFERYLEGIAEVPPSWPVTALEAQAIAARSYALASTGWSDSQGETLGRCDWSAPGHSSRAFPVHTQRPIPERSLR